MAPCVLIDDRLEHLQACAERASKPCSMMFRCLLIVLSLWALKDHGCPQGRLWNALLHQIAAFVAILAAMITISKDCIEPIAFVISALPPAFFAIHDIFDRLAAIDFPRTRDTNALPIVGFSNDARE